MSWDGAAKQGAGKMLSNLSRPAHRRLLFTRLSVCFIFSFDSKPQIHNSFANSVAPKRYTNREESH